MGREIKIRYVYKRKEDDKIWIQIIPIESLEGKGDKVDVSNIFWDIIARNLYTGLKDIYEGDIVRIIEPDEDSCMGATFEHTCLVCFGGGGYPCSFTIKNEGFWRGFALLYNERYEYEVIGNIYENPDLLQL